MRVLFIVNVFSSSVLGTVYIFLLFISYFFILILLLFYIFFIPKDQLVNTDRGTVLPNNNSYYSYIYCMTG